MYFSDVVEFTTNRPRLFVPRYTPSYKPGKPTVFYNRLYGTQFARSTVTFELILGQTRGFCVLRLQTKRANMPVLSGSLWVEKIESIRVSASHSRAEIRELIRCLGRARVMRPQPLMFRSKTKSQGDVERFERTHLMIEPTLCIRPLAVCPTESRSQPAYPQISHDADGFIQTRIFEMEPLANSNCRSEFMESMKCSLRHRILPDQAHVEVPVI